MSYKITTEKSWLQTRSDISSEMRLWGIGDKDWLPEQIGTAARVTYILRGKTVELLMDKQERPQDNLRVLYYAIKSLRLNEVRGMAEVFESAYLQLSAPVLEKDPYDVLGLPRGTATAVCEAQYKELLKKYHPDVPGGSAEKTKELNEAIDKIRKL